MYKRVSFVTRSLLWALLFYTISLMILDWKSVVASLKSGGNKGYVTSERYEHSLPKVTTVKVSPESSIGMLNRIIKLAGYVRR